MAQSILVTSQAPTGETLIKLYDGILDGVVPTPSPGPRLAQTCHILLCVHI